ncbi:hypothetical protein [Fimbriiglobus ruber]|uniref:Uncharacterized protein n=1 Tax=Fimbriiglobus ruber TaxID=1908690 RepID=A0A225DFY2_9BACT|nr:hypothetical protein [Fimbriiglobus ruber]OWK39883.1 hypothetical protein FRUB_05773 [Fimbriiglobus ruber]
MTTLGRIERLEKVYFGRDCPACGRAFHPPEDPTPEWDPPAEYHRVICDTLGPALKRSPEPPDPCPKCRRPADPDGWNFAIKYATPVELGRLEPAFKKYMPAYVYFDKGKWRG